MTRRYLRNTTRDVIVDLSDINVDQLPELTNVAKGLKALTKLVRKHKQIVINELYNNMVNANLEVKENRLKAQLLFSKLNGVISKRLERTKYAAFNEIKLNCIKVQSMERSGKHNEIFSNNTTNVTGTMRDKLLRFGTDSDFKITQSTNAEKGYVHHSGSNINVSGNSSLKRAVENQKHKLSVHQFSSSLIGNIIKRDQLTLDNNLELAIAMTPADSYNRSTRKKSQKRHIEEKPEEHVESDPETKDLDDYLSRRLAKLEETKRSKRTQPEPEVKISNRSKHSKANEKFVVDEDSEYEYILESEEEEDEWEGDSEAGHSPDDKIFSNSFLRENNPNPRRKSKVNKPNQPAENPLQLISKINKGNTGTIAQTQAKRAKLLEGGKVVQIEERKEDSYIHPALDNSSAFSNISAIFGQHNFVSNQKNMLSFQEESFLNDYDDLEFEHDLSELCNNSDSKKRKKAKRMNSMLETVSDGEYREIQMDNNVKYLRNDMDKITKDLEKIRDLVMQSPDAKVLVDAEFEEVKGKRIRKQLKEAMRQNDDDDIDIDDLLEGEEDEYSLPEYNSREISDLINNKIALSPRFKDRHLDEDDDSDSDE